MKPDSPFDPRLQAYLDGELERAEQLALEAEMKSRPDLVEQLELLRRVGEMARASARPVPPEGFQAAVRERIRTAPAAPWRRLWPAAGRPGPALAWGTLTTACLAAMLIPRTDFDRISNPKDLPVAAMSAEEAPVPPPPPPAAEAPAPPAGPPAGDEALPPPAGWSPAAPAITESVELDATAAPEAEGRALAEAEVADALEMAPATGSARYEGAAAAAPGGGPAARTGGAGGDFSAAESYALRAQPRRRTEAMLQARQDAPAARLEAGETDDNEAFGKYLAYWRDQAPRDAPGLAGFDPTERYVIQVVDEDGVGVPDVPLWITPSAGHQPQSQHTAHPAANLTTDASGQAVYFAAAATAGPASDFLVATPPPTMGRRPDADGFINRLERPAACVLTMSRRAAARYRAEPMPLDVAFVVDTTGSMSEEIDRIRETIDEVAARIAKLPRQPRLRLGLVLYRDRDDAYVTKVKPLTGSVATFQSYLRAVTADGGGDTPEDVCAALGAAVTDLEWHDAPALRLAFLVGDAPPHLDYPNQRPYIESIRASAAKGIKWFAVSSSDNEDVGEFVWRQLALMTRGRFLFITKGGAAGYTPHHVERQDYTVQALPDLVVSCVERELAALGKRPPEVTPVAIEPPNLGQDVVLTPPLPAPPPEPEPRRLPLWALLLILAANAAGWTTAYRRSRRALRPTDPPRGPRWRPPAEAPSEES